MLNSQTVSINYLKTKQKANISYSLGYSPCIESLFAPHPQKPFPSKTENKKNMPCKWGIRTEVDMQNKILRKSFTA